MTRRSSHRKTGFRWLLLALLIVLIVGFRLVEQIGTDRFPEDRFRVVEIVDGDTAVLAGGDRLRLMAIDTPEKDQPFYDSAAAYLGACLLGRQVRLEYGRNRRDRYGRLLAFVYVDTLLVNQAVLAQGLGNLYLFDDSEPDRAEVRRMLTAQREALADRRGIWSLPRQPEEYYLAAAGSYRFHRPGCPAAEKANNGNWRRIESFSEAINEGLSPCRRCKP